MFAFALTDPRTPTVGNRRWLEGAPRAVLARVKQVKLIRESRLVEIVASKLAADAIFGRIVDTLSNARSTELDLDLVSPKPPKPAFLEEAGRATNTVIRFNPSSKKARTPTPRP